MAPKEWKDLENLVSDLMGPSLTTIVIALTAAIFIPILLHFLIYRSTSSTALPSFLLVGPSGSGKTSLMTLFERGQVGATHTSQAPLAVEVSLPISTPAASSAYRSVNDPSLQIHKRFLLADTPGHGKLRYHALSSVVDPQNLRGILFVVDAATLSSGDGGSSNDGLREAAEYLHDILLQLQKRTTNIKSSRAVQETPVLVAANKLDLFTALPAVLVRAALESEIDSVRKSRAKGLLDSGVGMNDMENTNEQDWLGEYGDNTFQFSQLEENNIRVTVVGGNVTGTDGSHVEEWWKWIGSNL